MRLGSGLAIGTVDRVLPPFQIVALGFRRIPHRQGFKHRWRCLRRPRPRRQPKIAGGSSQGRQASVGSREAAGRQKHRRSRAGSPPHTRYSRAIMLRFGTCRVRSAQSSNSKSESTSAIFTPTGTPSGAKVLTGRHARGHKLARSRAVARSASGRPPYLLGWQRVRGGAHERHHPDISRRC